MRRDSLRSCVVFLVVKVSKGLSGEMGRLAGRLDDHDIAALPPSTYGALGPSKTQDPPRDSPPY